MPTMSEQIAARPRPEDVINNGRLRASSNPLAGAMLRDFLELPADKRAELLFWALQDIAAEQNRMMHALSLIRQQLTTLTTPPAGSA